MDTKYARVMGRQIAAAWREHVRERLLWLAGETVPPGSQGDVFKLVRAYMKAQRERAKELAGLSARNAYWTHRELGLALRLRSDKDGQRAEMLGCGGMTEEEVRALGVWELGQRRARRLEAHYHQAMGLVADMAARRDSFRMVVDGKEYRWNPNGREEG